MSKRYLSENVYNASMKRMKILFNDFDNVLVAFSGGKDSGVMLNLAYEYAKQNNLLHKLSMYYMDYECGYKFTHDYVGRVFDYMDDISKKYWLCLPIRAACAVSMHQTSWIPWDKEKRDIWVREYPNDMSVVTEDNCPFPFKKGTKGFDARIEFSQWFAKKYGKTAVLVGIRADESLSRLSIFTSNDRKFMHKEYKWTKKVDELTYAAYPIYDWVTDDIWIGNSKFGWDYNKIYDLYYQAGLSIAQMRVASPFHQCGQANLKLFRVIDPDSWGKMVGRVNGVNFTGIYGGTTAMGWKSIKKPEHFTWKEYAEFLLNTLPEETKKKYLEKIEKSKWHWRVQGGARDKSFIEQLEKEGWKIRRTNEKANRGHKQKELIFIDDMEDDTNVDDFRRAPTWKRVCITIMKNDFTCLFMGFQRTKDQNEKRKQALEKYKNL